MFLLLNSLPGTPGDAPRILTRVSDGPGVSAPDALATSGGSDDSRFSRLLAGQLDHPRNMTSASERSFPAEGRSNGRNDADSLENISSHNRTGPEGRNEHPGGNAGADSQTPGGLSLFTWDAMNLSGAQLSGIGFDLLAPVIDPTGPGIAFNLDPARLDAIPMEIRSQLAADIAARFTDRNGSQTLTLKLDPAHLGKLDVKLESRDKHLTVRIQASSRESEAALRENIKDLADSIQKQVGKFQQVDVKVELKQGENLDRHTQEERSGNSPDDGKRENAGKEDGAAPGRRDADATDTEPDSGVQGG